MRKKYVNKENKKCFITIKIKYLIKKEKKIFNLKN